MAINISKSVKKVEDLEHLDHPVSIGQGSMESGHVAKPMKTVGKGELATIMAAIRKTKGENLIIQGSAVQVVERIPTGMFEVDLALGGGFPRGRYSIVYGPEGSGKTNLTYCMIANAQRLPPPCNKAVFVDLEGTFDPEWAKMFGIDVDELIVVKPSYGEEAMDMIDALVRADDVAALVVDSLAVVVSTKEMEQSSEKFDVGTTAILIKRMCNKLIMALSQEQKRGHTPCVILLNQTRFKVGVMFGDPETMPGGKTMLFLSSLTIRVYGKNKIMKEVHPELAAFKETAAVIKKAKVPITRLSFDYEMCVYPHDGLGVGETRSWSKLQAQLQELGHLVKGKTWTLTLPNKTISAPTLVTLQDTYESDPEFAQACQALVINSSKGKMFLHAAEGAAK